MFGDGFFTSFRIENGTIVFHELHKQRLLDTAQRLGCELSRARVETAFQQCLTLSKKAEAVISQGRVVAQFDGAEHYENGIYHGYRRQKQSVDLHISVKSLPKHANHEAVRTPLIIHSCQTRLPRFDEVAGLKTVNALPYVLACNELTQTTADEGLLFDYDGHVIEACHANIFIEYADHVWTPELKKCGVAGVFRQWLLAQLNAKGVSVDVSEKGGSDALADAQSLWLTNSVYGARQVAVLDGNSVPMVGRYIMPIQQTWQRSCQSATW